MAAATKELMWLSEKEEEEVGFDWSERNANMAAKKESYSVRRPRRLRSGPRSGSRGRAWRGRGAGGPQRGPAPSLSPAASMAGPDA